MGRSWLLATAVAVLAGCGRVGFSAVFEHEADGAIVRIGDGNQLGDGVSSGDGGGDAAGFDCDTSLPELVCPGTGYCQTPLGTCGGRGNCVEPPPVDQICADVFLCGCDGKNYASVCAAERAHVSLFSSGICS